MTPFMVELLKIGNIFKSWIFVMLHAMKHTGMYDDDDWVRILQWNVQNHGHTSVESYARTHIVKTNSLNPQSTSWAKSEICDFYSTSVLLHPVSNIRFFMAVGSQNWNIPYRQSLRCVVYSWRVWKQCSPSVSLANVQSHGNTCTAVALSILQLAGRKKYKCGVEKIDFHDKTIFSWFWLLWRPPGLHLDEGCL